MSMYQVPFIAASSVPTPPAGEVILFFDLSNSNRLSRKDSSGTVVDLQSGASYTDAEAVAAVQTEITGATVKSRMNVEDLVYIKDSLGGFKTARSSSFLKRNPQRFFNLFEDFLTSVTGDFVAFTSGTGASHQSGLYGNDLVENAIGVTQGDTGTTAVGRAGIGLSTPASLKPGAARFLYEGRHAIEAVSTLSETFTVWIGLTDAHSVSGEGTSGLHFRYTDLQNGGRWEAISRAGGTDLIAVDTGIAPDLDYHVYQVELDEDALQARFHIDGNLVATINAPNLPNATHMISAGAKIQKSVGTSQRNISHDYIYFELERASDR